MERTDEDLLTAQEVARHLDVKDRVFRDLRKAGEFPPPVRIGSSVRWRWGTVREWLRAVELVQALTPRMMGGRKRQKAAKVGDSRQSPADAPNDASDPKKRR